MGLGGGGLEFSVAFHQTSNNQTFCFQFIFKLGKSAFLETKLGKRFCQVPSSFPKLNYLMDMMGNLLGLSYGKSSQIRRPDWTVNTQLSSS